MVYDCGVTYNNLYRVLLGFDRVVDQTVSRESWHGMTTCTPANVVLKCLLTEGKRARNMDEYIWVFSKPTEGHHLSQAAPVKM